MSEYQYYEFQAIDQALSEEERAEIGSWSSRTTPTATQAIFTYSYSDFPRSSEKVLAKYFDAMLYLTNWGTKQLIFRFPQNVVDSKSLALYSHADSVSVVTNEKYVILNINLSEEEGENMIEGEGWLSLLLPLRDDIMTGDYRVLYLAWLQAIAMEYELEEFEENLEPPVPANHQSMTPALESFVDLFEIDDGLLAFAAENSATVDKKPVIDIENAVDQLTDKDRTDFLVRLATGESHVRAKLLKRLQTLNFNENQKSQPLKKRRTVSEMLSSERDIFEDCGG